ncbi:MAG: AAA family ATPase [Porphyromonas sp.]|uniref:bifunctional DNA primase/helicase n=1 Tax=Porphyromonas sp. TaxID=1924944 RepID=UPI001A386D2E|nr:bifunctional DNA primase/helicase [Porphyromonas sp.]MBL6452675.1 AAA family ATPase [Porphyromonas sp.]
MIDKKQILELTAGGLNVFIHYLGFPVNVHKNFLSPFYEDTKPSCHIYFDAKSDCYKFHDHGDPSYSGDCFWFVGELYNLSVRVDFRKILQQIVVDLRLPIRSDEVLDRVALTNKAIRISNPKTVQPIPKSSKARLYSLEPLPFTKGFLDYWSKYGITEKTLKRYGVINLQKFSSINSEGNEFSLIAKETEPIFGYQGKDFIKIYRPFSTRLKFLYGGEKPSLYCFGLDQLPAKGDVIFITGGEKDVLSLSAHGFNAICFNSETSQIPKKIVEGLTLRFKHVVLLYDVDETGIREVARQKLELQEYKIYSLRLPLVGSKYEKDISDFFALGHTSYELKDLLSQLLKSLYAETLMIMKSCELDYSNPPHVSNSIVSINDVPLGSQDNLLCITGGEGTGKSNYVSAVVSGAICYNKLAPGETLGIDVSPNPYGMAVIHYDTEQSEAQLYKNMRKTLSRAGLREMPPFYHCLYLASLSRKDRIHLIEDSLDLFYHQHGGIHLVVIDGIADLVRSANDETESIAVVDELYRLAGIYNTCIICVLHFVPNGIKLRGHIGSELQRKSAGILSIEKDDNPEYSVVKALKVRDGSPLDVPMMLFGWDKGLEMHVYRGEKSKEDKEKRKTDELISIVTEIFQSNHRLSYQELCDVLMREMGVKERTAKKYIAYMREQRILSQDTAGNYQKGELCHT